MLGQRQAGGVEAGANQAPNGLNAHKAPIMSQRNTRPAEAKQPVNARRQHPSGSQAVDTQPSEVQLEAAMQGHCLRIPRPLFEELRELASMGATTQMLRNVLARRLPNVQISAAVLARLWDKLNHALVRGLQLWAGHGVLHVTVNDCRTDHQHAPKPSVSSFTCFTCVWQQRPTAWMCVLQQSIQRSSVA